MTEPTIVTLADAAACAESAAERIVEVLDVAIDDRGEAHWVTTGGSTPAAIYETLVGGDLRDEIDWRRVHLWFTDERFVPPDHPLSNAKIVEDILLVRRAGEVSGLPIPIDQVHPIPMAEAIGGGHGPDWAAARYVEAIQADGPDTNDDDWPTFDLILLGIGPDGHILSVFPESEAFDDPAWAVGIPAPTHVEPHVARVSLHPMIVPAARDLLVVTHGAGKADVLERVLHGPRDERRLPAQLARRPGATWIVDQAAAARL